MKARFLSLLVFILANLLNPASSFAQNLLGSKLFTSPEQRQYLDYLRKDYLEKNRQKGFNIVESEIPDIPTAIAGAPAAPEQYTFEGVVKRANGQLTIWLNHQTLTEKQLPANVKVVKDGNTLALRFVTRDNVSKLVLPGQTIDLTSGKVDERLLQGPPTKPEVTASAAATNSSPANPPPANAEKTADSTDTKVATAMAEPGPKSQAAAAETSKVSEATANPAAAAVPPPIAADVLKNPQALDSLIRSLQTVLEGLDDK